MTKSSMITALMSAQALPVDAGEAGAPDWVHLLPTSAGEIATGDKRGPYHVTDAAKVIAESFRDQDSLPIDENHAIDNAAPAGHPSPARGWIVEMQAREDGIWGRVEWSKAGAELVSSRAYRGLSPAILHDKGKTIHRILRASLVNRPNLRGLAALNQEEDDMPFNERLVEALGLKTDAGEDDILASIKTLTDGGDTTALQSQVSQIGVALGLDEGAEPEAVLNAAKTAGDGADKTIVALQSELSSVTKQLNALSEGNQRGRAEAFVDGAVKAGRVGVKPQRDRFIALHMKDPEGTEEMINSFPVLGRSGTNILPPKAKEGEVSLNSEQSTVARMLGQDPKDYAATLADERGEEEAL